MNKLAQTGIWALLLTVLFYPITTNLGDFHTADEKRWYANVVNFTLHLAHGEFDQLLQQPHPGITTQWFALPTVFSDSWQVRKLPLSVSQGILVLLIGYISYRLWGKKEAILLLFLLATNTLLIAHMRIYAMDSLLALFSILSLLTLLLWQKNHEHRYLLFSAACASAAALSKLPGIVLAPLSGAFITYSIFADQSAHKAKNLFSAYGIWLSGFIIASILILPQLVVVPASVIGDMLEIFSSDDYTVLHQERFSYYFRTLIFFSTPAHIAGILLTPLAWRYLSSARKTQLIYVLTFAILFITMMGIGAKKGDRYILPAFLALDVVTAIVGTTLLYRSSIQWKRYTTAALIGIIAWQAALVIRLHPYELAYVNPVTKPLFAQRRLGWGEGLDIAAEYLNAKESSSDLKVASYYSSEFAFMFIGETVPLHQWDTGNADYAVLYRAMYERGADAWETDVLHQFQEKQAERVIQLNGLPYVWIYKL